MGEPMDLDLGAAAAKVKAKEDQDQDDPWTQIAKKAKQLEAEWKKGKKLRNLEQINQLLTEAKIMLAQLDAFLPKDGARPNDLINAQTVLEISAFYSVEKLESNQSNDPKKEENLIDEFGGFTSLLKHYYLDYDGKVIPDSPYKYELICAKLLNLLADNRIAYFHEELALILHPPEEAKNILCNNPILYKTMKIAESLEDGRYNALGRKVATPRTGGNTTEQDRERRGDDALHASEACKYFLGRLIICTRPYIAETLERSYGTWSKEFAMDRLHITSAEELDAIATKRKWTLQGDYYTHKSDNAEKIPAEKLIKKFLTYAKNMEEII